MHAAVSAATTTTTIHFSLTD